MFNRKKLRNLEEQLAAAEQANVELNAIVARHGMRAFEDVDAYRNHVEFELGMARSAAEQHAIAERQNADDSANQRREIENEIRQLEAKAVNLRDTANLQDLGLFDYEHPAENSTALASKLEHSRELIKQSVRDKVATTASTQFTYNGSEAKGRKLVSDMSKILLRAYNAEAENGVKSVRAGNLEAAKKRLQGVADQIERQGAMMNLKVQRNYQRLRMLELELAAKHLQAVKAEKEAEREHKAQLREQAKAERELRAERDRLEKERQHYLNVLNKLKMAGGSAADADTDEIASLEAELSKIDNGIENIEYRSANIRAGYVYVISNIGSFGDQMVKIGMTRRLDPMDRVRELSDASVPFNFDVHALFFSDDAVGVETALHRKFADRRANLVNGRREFFMVPAVEVRDALAAINGNILEFTQEPEAEQYRETLAMRESARAQEVPAGV